MDNIKKISGGILAAFLMLLATSCTLPPSLVQRRENKSTPATYANRTQDSTNTGKIQWREFFKDPNLVALIDTALGNNQELNISLQEINIARNEVRARKGEYLPFVDFGVAGGVEKVGQYTRSGAVEETDEIQPGKPFPNPLGDYVIGPRASWEIDIWKKLRTARKSAMFRYLSTGEGRNFLITNLIAEIATSYYELMALDNQLSILRQNIEIQQNALEIVKLEKQAAKVTELAVTKFQAEVAKNQSRQYELLQMITVTENRINFLVGRFPQPISRDSQSFMSLLPDSINTGIPAQLLLNRPDIRQAELELAAARLDIKVARANFYPSLRVTAGVGLQAFNPQYLMNTPQSLMYSLMGDIMAPLINRNAIKAQYYSASSKQIQTAFNYERTVLNAYIEVANQLSNIHNLKSSYDLKSKQVEALTRSINISTGLFKSARADYMEVLMTQRDALDSRFDLIDTRMQQMHAMVNIYQALGGGWR